MDNNSYEYRNITLTSDNYNQYANDKNYEIVKLGNGHTFARKKP